MSLPSEMNFVDVPAPGGPENMVLKKGPLPEVKPGDILVRVEAAGINRPDVLQRKGDYPPPPGASPILGLEVAGEIVALGEGPRAFGSATRSARSPMAAVMRNTRQYPRPRRSPGRRAMTR